MRIDFEYVAGRGEKDFELCKESDYYISDKRSRVLMTSEKHIVRCMKNGIRYVKLISL